MAPTPSSRNTHPPSFPTVSVTLVACGIACFLVAILTLQHRTASGGHAGEGEGRFKSLVPLASLLPRSVTFPSLLSDNVAPTTALIVLKKSAAPLVRPVSLPEDEDKEDIVAEQEKVYPPLPAQHVLHASPLVTRPRDPLMQRAGRAGGLYAPRLPEAAEGHEAGYRLQVSSFASAEEAASFVAQLRARKHRAYALAVQVHGRGMLHRVRIGPFVTRAEAAQYRKTFEQKEKLVAFLLVPSHDS